MQHPVTKIPETFKDVQEIMKQELGDKGSRKEQMDATGQMEFTPRSRWERLKREINREIDSIDAATPFSASEPRWWLEMMDVQRLVDPSVLEPHDNQ